MSDIEDEQMSLKNKSVLCHSLRDGSKCCVVGCRVSSAACRGLSFPSLPKKGVSAEQDKWRESMIIKIGRTDSKFNPDKARICSRHFEDGCIKYGPSGKCTGLVLGSMPTHWMPTKSVETPKPPQRPVPVERIRNPTPEKVAYYNLEDIKKDLKKVNLPWIVKENSATSVRVCLPADNGWKVIVSLDSETAMQANVQVFGLAAPHLTTNLEYKKLTKFLDDLQAMAVCSGVTEESLQAFAGAPNEKCSYYRHHEYHVQNGKMSQVSCVRSQKCLLLLSSMHASYCKPCQYVRKLLINKKKRQENRVLQPLKDKDPLHALDKSKLKEALKECRQEKVQLKCDLKEFQRRITTESIPLDSELHHSLNAVDISGIENPLQKLFWEEQQKAFQKKLHGMRWHPMILRLAILLQSKSKAAYETLRKTGVLKLPGSATLKEYTGCDNPEQGFRPEVMEELTTIAEKLDPHQRYVVLLHDEMSIKQDLVYDQRSGALIGFSNKDKWTFDANDHQNQKDHATHALVFYVVGLNSNLKMSVGYFATRNARADELMPLLWEAINCVEACGLWVVASTSDKAPQNQRLYHLHQNDQQEIVCYKTRNFINPEREVFFFSDPPHLMKTIRNNLASSGSGKNTKYLWNDGDHLLWSHVANIYQEDMHTGLRRTKLTSDHIHLTPHSVMNVRLAVQVLSHTVGRVLTEYGREDTRGTAKFILLMDRLFDCLNGRHLNEAEHKLKPDLRQYDNPNDPRFDFLETEFLGYLNAWKASVDNRPGFNRAEKQTMFLTHQTYKGLVMTVRAFVEATRFLLRNGVSFVLSNKFCQDPLELHFGRHRAMGRTAENPNVFQFGHQEYNIRLQRQLSLLCTPRGNVSTVNQDAHIPISTSPLKKKARNQLN